MNRRPSQSYQFALITGASGGIGSGFARAMPRRTGLLLTGRDSARLAAVAEEARGEGRPVETVVADLTSPEDRAAVVERAQALGIDLFVNNAGLGHLGSVLQHDEAVEAAMIDVNVVAMAALTRALLPGMIERARPAESRAGLIVVASSTAFAPLPYLATYAATKAFALHFTEGLAEELRRQPVDVLALCPGATRTGIGAESGFAASSVPGAADPTKVARQALAALGRRRVLVTGVAGAAATAPFLGPRRLVTESAGMVMRLVSGRLART